MAGASDGLPIFSHIMRLTRVIAAPLSTSQTNLCPFNCRLISSRLIESLRLTVRTVLTFPPLPLPLPLAVVCARAGMVGGAGSERQTRLKCPCLPQWLQVLSFAQQAPLTCTAPQLEHGVSWCDAVASLPCAGGRRPRAGTVASRH